MDFLQALTLFGGAALIVAVTVAVGKLVVTAKSRGARPPRDELLRAGNPDEVNEADAGNRALGSTAWMRPDGGGF